MLLVAAPIVLFVLSGGHPKVALSDWTKSSPPTHGESTAVGDAPAFAMRRVVTGGHVPPDVRMSSSFALTASGTLLKIETPCGVVTVSGEVNGGRVLLDEKLRTLPLVPQYQCTELEAKSKAWLLLRLGQGPRVASEGDQVSLTWEAEDATGWDSSTVDHQPESLILTPLGPSSS